MDRRQNLKVYRYSLPLQTRNWQVREGLIVQSDIGFGEIAPLPGFSRETLADAHAELLAILRTSAPPTLPSVRFGLASAKKPLRSVRLPLCSLGPQSGFPAIKLKLGYLSLPDAIALVKQHLGTPLRLDCNRSWTLDQALDFASHFEPTDFAYLEEPVRHFSDLIRFSQLTHFPLALDESIHSDWTQLPSLRAIVVKPTVVGAIPPIPPHLDLILSSSYESGLGLLHIAQLAQEHRLSQPIGLDTYRTLQDDILTVPIDCSSGCFSWDYTDPPLNFSKLKRIL
jgi:O-succinylbenzoate synthase